MSIEEKIRAHEEEILSGKMPADLKQCPKCYGNPESFKSHGLRQRIFYVIIGGFVYRIESFLGRWKCVLCNCTFTYYPDFSLPFKRYPKDSILPLAEKYVEENTTYQEVVQNDDGSPISFESSGGDRSLGGSTIWRWLDSVGSLKDRLMRAFDLIRQKSPSSTIFREIRPILSGKYKSESRKILLGFCQRFFIAEAEFKRLFFISIFPKFATGFL